MSVIDEVIAIVEKTTKIPKEKLDIDADFGSIGMDSILAMELISGLSERFSVSITPANFTDIESVREMAEFIEEQTATEPPESNPSKIKESLSEVLPVEKIENSTSPKREIRAKTSRGNRSSSRHKSRSFRKNSSDRLINRINDKFAIDLSSMRFKSTDETIQFLVTNHSDDLLQHYGLQTIQLGQHEDVFEEKTENAAVVKQDLNFAGVAVVGLSCRFPDAPDASQFWTNLLERKSSIQEIPKSRWDTEKYYSIDLQQGKTISKWGALLDDVDCFDPSFFGLSPEEAVVVDPQERLLLQETYKAFQDAGINIQNLAESNTGIFIGYEYAEYEHHLRSAYDADIGIPPFNSSSQTYYLANRLSYLFNFCGPSESINVNCASSAVAINRAFQSLQTRESDVVAVGSACLNLFVDDYIAGSNYGMLSPNGTCAVFDDDANGFTRGEGVAVVIMKRLEDAIQDNDRIYSVVKASHQNNRGRASDISEIKHESITDVLNGCYAQANIDPHSIDHIEVDGYSTKWGDSFEFEGIKNIFDQNTEKEKFCSLGSVKGNIGHLEPASGLASLIKLSLSMYYKRIPASNTVKNINSFIDIQNKKHPLFIANEDIHFDSIRRGENIPVRAGINSFADSGVNVHLLLEEYIDVQFSEPPSLTDDKKLFVLSAHDRPALERYIHLYAEFLNKNETNISLDQVIYTLQLGREAMPERLAIVVDSIDQLVSKLSYIDKHSLEENSLKDRDIFYASLTSASEDSSFSNIITGDLSESQLMQSLDSQEWQPVALLWIKGFDMPWSKAWRGIDIQPVSLPLYPFAKEPYWLEMGENAESDTKQPPAKPQVEKRETKSSSSFEELWKFHYDEQLVDASEMDGTKKVMQFLKQHIARELQIPIGEVSVTDDFISLGLSSLGIASLVQQVNDFLKEFLSPSLLFKYFTVQALAEYLAENYAQKTQYITVENHGGVEPNESDLQDGKLNYDQQEIIENMILQEASTVDSLEKINL